MGAVPRRNAGSSDNNGVFHQWGPGHHGGGPVNVRYYSTNKQKGRPAGGPISG